ncbi:SNF1-related protein kinase regulatory subunit beta-1-like [Macadamia integrifolia]|uniref:SNF1-related protein kinase regulatory subunit beta-1-like n=1 Tax=Macadamia integrifolia TaxID=60698 RepID=UPI001C52BBBF|nr:SNF1-related protein kinase regulatory subunit beta-1-like [Macadamia integrifolia]
MGNASGKEEGENGSEDLLGRSDGKSAYHDDFSVNSYSPARANSVDSMGNSPPPSPGRFRSPLMFAPQAPVAPLQRGDASPVFNQLWLNESHGDLDLSPEKGIPTMITWTYGGNNVAVEGSWDNWAQRKMLQKSGKDHSILLVLPSGIYQYKFIVDGEWRYIPDLPCIADETGNVCNLLDVHDYVPENPESVAEFEPPSSPDSSYTQVFPGDEDFAKEPVAVPPQMHLTVLGMPNSAESSSTNTKPQHVVLNHLFIEKGWASQSLVALGLTHRFQSKYVTVVLYKPLRR